MLVRLLCFLHFNVSKQTLEIANFCFLFIFKVDGN